MPKPVITYPAAAHLVECLLADASVATAVIDLDGLVRHANSAYRKMIAPDFPPRDADEAEAARAWIGHIATGGTDSLDRPGPTPGSIVRVHGMPIAAGRDDPPCILITAEPDPAMHGAQARLDRETRLLDAATEASSIGLWRVIPQTQGCWFSPSWFTSLGYRPGELDSTLESFASLLHPDDIERVVTDYQCGIDDPDGLYSGDFRMRRKDGSYAWIGSAGKVIDDPEVPGGRIMVGAQIDISERVQTRQQAESTARAAQETLQRLTLLTDNVPGGIYEFRLSPEGKVSWPYYTREFSDLVSMDDLDVEKDPDQVFRLLLDEDRQALQSSIYQSAIDLSVWKLTFRLQHPQRGLIYLRGNSTPVRLPDGATIWHGCLMDVTEEVQRQNELEEARRLTEALSLLDPLTDLPNRRSFDAEFERRAGHPAELHDCFTLIRVDLDNFKFVNDTLGHAAGDTVLKFVAQSMKDLLGEGRFAARLGGDEFVVLLAPGETVEVAMDFVRDLRRRLKTPLFHEGNLCRFDASFGISSSPVRPVDPVETLNFADTALYEAKKSGRGRVVTFTPELHARLALTRRRAEQLQAGIDRGEFIPFFQPQIDAATGQIAGFEVLARWEHPQDGMLLPDDFIPIAEKVRLVQDIDSLIFTKSIAVIDRLSTAGFAIPKLSFNVTAGRILDPDIIRSAALLQRKGTVVALELLETFLLEEEGAVFDSHLDLLKANGIEIEVDDFGSGHASIIGVRRVAPNALKIDKRLILPMIEDAESCELVGAIINIGKSMRIDVTAEGVESLEHAQLLRAMGCRTLQGYHFARPMPEDEMVRFLKAYRPARFESDGRKTA